MANLGKFLCKRGGSSVVGVFISGLGVCEGDVRGDDRRRMHCFGLQSHTPSVSEFGSAPTSPQPSAKPHQ